MQTSSGDWLPPKAEAALAACRRGELAPNVALMRLILALPSPGAVDRAIARSGHAGQQAGFLAKMHELWRKRRDSFDIVRAVARSHDHEAASAPNMVTACARAFDASAAISPEAGVALYSLGDAELLQTITAEIVERMRQWGLARPGEALLEIGCGTGRFVAAFAPQVRRVTGVDISARMIEAARERCAGLGNARLIRTHGLDLGYCADASLDLIYAIDSFPYIVQSGDENVRRHFEEAGRVLKPGAHFLMLNFSYRGDPARDSADVRRLCALAGLELVRDKRGDFGLWDGATFLMRGPAGG